MKQILIFVLATALYASVKSEESTTLPSQLQSENPAEVQPQRRTSELIETSVNNVEKLYRAFLDEIQLLELNLTTHQQLLAESKLETTMLQAKLESEHSTVVQLQQQMSVLADSDAKAETKHQAQDKDYDKLLKEMQQMKMNMTIQQNQLNVLQQKPAVQWVQWSVNDPLPKNAVYAGQNADSSPMYVGRTLYKGLYSVVKVCPTLRNGYFSYYGQELTVTNCEVLTGTDFSWQWGFNGGVPEKGVLAGQSGRYVGRAHHANSLNPGTIDKGTNGAIYIGVSGKEYRYEAYQVLVHD